MSWEDCKCLKWLDNPWYIFSVCSLMIFFLFFDFFLGVAIPMWIGFVCVVFSLVGLAFFGLLMGWKEG
jgi:membrane-bound ClpP family serine protease